jgi:hypothetical protein
MENLFLTFSILLLFLSSGDWLLNLLLPQISLNLAIRFVLSSWFGLISLVIVYSNLYYLSNLLTIGQIALPVILGFGCFSIIFFVFRRQRRERVDLFSILALILPIFSILFLSIPTLGIRASAYHIFLNNWEFINYAALADVIQFSPANMQPPGPALPLIGSREAIVSILCASFSTIFHKSSLFLVEPLSNAFAYLFFASMGLLIRRVQMGFPINRIQKVILVSIFALFCASSGTLNFWNLSFLSNYFSISIFFGLLLFLTEIESNHSFRDHPFPAILAIGLCVACWLIGYPEMLVPNSVFISIYLLLLLKPKSIKQVSVVFFHLFLSLGLSIIIVNRGGFLIFRRYLQIFNSPAGWSFYGDPSDGFRTLSNLLGLSNIYLSPPAIYKFGLFIYLLGVLYIIVHLVHDLSIRRPRDKWGLIFQFMFLFFLIGLPFLRYIEINGNNPTTSYKTIKFAASFLGFFYIALAYLFSKLQSRKANLAVFCVIVFLLWNVGLNTQQWARFMAQNSMLFSEDDARRLQTKIREPEEIYWFPQTPPQYMILLGHFMVMGSNLVRSIDFSNYVIQEKTQYRGQPFVLGIGRDASAVPKVLGERFEMIVQGDFFTLYRKTGT